MSTPKTAADHARATEAAYIAAAEAAILAAEPLFQVSSPQEMSEDDSDAEKSVAAPEAEEKQPRRRTARGSSEAPKRKAAPRTGTAAPRRTPRKKPAADAEGNE